MLNLIVELTERSFMIVRFINIPGFVRKSMGFKLKKLERQHNFKFCVDTYEGAICQLCPVLADVW